MLGPTTHEPRDATENGAFLDLAPRVKPPKIVIADDHGILLEGLKKILEPEFEVVAMVRDGHALIRAVETLRPDVAVAGIAMPVLNGIEALAQAEKLGDRHEICISDGKLRRRPGDASHAAWGLLLCPEAVRLG